MESFYIIAQYSHSILDGITTVGLIPPIFGIAITRSSLYIASSCPKWTKGAPVFPKLSD